MLVAICALIGLVALPAGASAATGKPKIGSVLANPDQEDAKLSATIRPDGISRAEPDSEVRLVPSLIGGTAGWSVEFRTTHTSGGGLPESTRGLIYGEGCSDSSTVTELDLLTSSSVAAVSVLGGPPIRTRTYPTFIDGLRAVVVELKRRKGQAMCPKVTPLNARLRPLSLQGKRSSPLRSHCPEGPYGSESLIQGEGLAQSHHRLPPPAFRPRTPQRGPVI